jgi:ribosomal protein S18 acetylase RimI-like enzyme
VAVALRAVSTDGDLERIVAVRAGIDPILETTADDLRFLSSRLRGPLHVLATLDGEPAGYGFTGVFPEQEDEPFAFADLGVLPAFRRRGVGSALHAALSEHVRGLGKQELQLEVREQDEEGLGYFQKRGYVEVERQKAVELDLRTLEPEVPQLSPGVEISSWAKRPDLAPRMYELYKKASADIPGLDAETDWTFAEWRARELERPARRHDLSFVALASEELVGYATLDVFPAGGFHGLTAVARAWRRRGVGRALKRTQIAAAKEAGLEKLFTESEESNEPMRRLNEELGFRPIPGMVVLRGPLVGASGEKGVFRL